MGQALIRIRGSFWPIPGMQEPVGLVSMETQDWRDWIDLTTGNRQDTPGRSREDQVAGALRCGLRLPGIRPEHIRLCQKIIDTDGAVFKPGQQKEIDLLFWEDDFVVFEVEVAARPRDVDEFSDIVALMRHLNPDKQVRGVFITLAPEPDVRQRCAELNIELAR